MDQCKSFDENTLDDVSEIKTWISNKLNQLEEKNLVLAEENKKVNEELLKLKQRYVKKSFTPEAKRRFTKSRNHRSNNNNYGNIRQLYRNKNYPTQNFNTTISSSSSSDSSNDDDNDDDDDDGGGGGGGDDSSSASSSNIVFSHRMVNEFGSKKNSNNNNNNNNSIYRNVGKRYNLNKKSSSLDRSLSKMKKLNFEKIKNHHNRKNYLDFVGGGEKKNESENNDLTNNNRPPTPPLHRLPSWESRIYEIANNGIQSAISTPVQHSKKLDFNDFQPNSATNSPPSFYASIIPQAAVADGRDQHENSTVSIIMNQTRYGGGDNKISYANVGSEKSAALFKSSNTSSGNESDSTITDPTRQFYVNDDDHVMANSISRSIDPNLCLDVCRDSLKKLTITSKHFPSNQQVFNGLFNNNENKIVKSGYIYKLSGTIKVWKRRWFVLKDGSLIYFRSKNDLNKTPKGTIVLDQNCSLVRSKELSFHISYQDGRKNLHLSCESIQSYNDWLLAIGQTLTINNILKLQDNQVPIIENYIIKVRFGHSMKCWTSLYNHHLVYFNNPFEKIPIGYTSLKDCTFQENTSVPDIEDVALIYDEIKKNIHYSISIHSKNNSEPIYLLFNTKQDFSLWYYHLKLAFTQNNAPKTAFENLLTTLLNIESSVNTKDEFYAHEIWNNPLLTRGSIDDIAQPLTSLYDNDLKKEASKLCKSINLFISVPIDSMAIDYHVTLVQNCLQVCFDHPELQAELYYQLMKQSSPSIDPLKPSPSTLTNNCQQQRSFWCSPHSIFKCESLSPVSNTGNGDIGTDSSANLSCSSSSMIQCVQFLAITISIFLPQNQVLWLLKHYINRFKNETTETGKYVLYCERALSRVLMNGARKQIPSRMEVLSIIQKNPYQHSMPHSIPVHFANNSYQVIGFDGSTTVSEFIQLINSESGIRDDLYSGFALYSDDPIDKGLEHLLDKNAKLSDAISLWETTMRKYNLGKFENSKIIKLIYKHRLFLRKYMKNETDKERLIWIYEINQEVINDRFPVTFDLAIELASLMIQIEYGNRKNHNDHNSILKQALPLFLPAKFHDHDHIDEIISKRWFELQDRSVLDCVRIYLNCTRKWNLCGFKLFKAKFFNCLKYDDLISLYLFKFFQNYSTIFIAIGEDFLELIEQDFFRPILRIPYKNMFDYGSIKSLFYMCIDQSCLNELLSLGSKSNESSLRNNKNGYRLLFIMQEQSISEIIKLIHDYIEIVEKSSTIVQDEVLPL